MQELKEIEVVHWKNLSLENIVEDIDGVVYTEEWRDIVDYEGLYQISSFGRCKALPKQWKGSNNNLIKKKSKILKARLEQGYIRFFLYKNSLMKPFQAHRLVAFSFIKNKQNKPHVNHLFGNKTDNRYMKLDWATRSEDELHSYRVLGKKPSNNWITNFRHQNSRPIVCLNTGEKYSSIAEAALKMNLNRRCINRVCKGSRTHTKNFNFKYL